MSSNTTCPICHTVFRISSLSLDESKGMVQCGVCGMVFDALQNADQIEDNNVSSPPSVESPIASVDLSVSTAEPLLEESAAANISSLPMEQLQETGSNPHQDIEYPEPEAAAQPDVSDSETSALPTVNSHTLPPTDASPTDISFISRTSRPHLYLWVVLALILSILLAVQFAVYYRDKLAANYPGIEPALGTICELANCRVQLPTDLDVIKITATSFEADTVNPSLISVHIGLENQSNMRVALPNLALTLTNDAEEIVVKRNFRPYEYLPSSDKNLKGIAGRSEISSHLVIDTKGISVSGYKITIFYDQK